MFHNRARTNSTPSRGTIPQGKGREGIRKGREGNASATSLVVESGLDQIQSNGHLGLVAAPIGFGDLR